MITIQLDSEGENRRGRLRSLKSPYIKRAIFFVYLTFILLANISIFSLDAPLTEKLIQSTIASISIVFVIWYFSSHRYSTTLGNTGETIHVINANIREFTYIVTENGVIEKCEGNEKLYPFSSYVSHGGSHFENWVIFNTGLIYLPKHAVKSGSIKAFLDEIQANI